MPTAYLLEFTGGTWKQYQALVRELNWKSHLDSANAGQLPGPSGSHFAVITVWESQLAFEVFFRTKLSRAVWRADLQLPSVKSWQVPRPDRNRLLKEAHQASSHPALQPNHLHPAWIALQILPVRFSGN